MTSNIDLAAEVLRRVDGDYTLGAGALAEALADAGLLASGTIEYRVEHQHIENGYWHPVTRWSPEWPLHDGHSVAPDERIVARRVSPEWVVTDE